MSSPQRHRRPLVGCDLPERLGGGAAERLHSKPLRTLEKINAVVIGVEV
jgi:hypothetical protein